MDILLLVLFVLTPAICVASWGYPWKALPTRRGVIALQLPWAAVVTYASYEWSMRRAGYNIRVDRLFVPVMAGVGLVTFLLYALRMIWVIRRRVAGRLATSAGRVK